MRYYYHTLNIVKCQVASLENFDDASDPIGDINPELFMGAVITDKQNPNQFQPFLTENGFKLVAQWPNKLNPKANLLYFWEKRPNNPCAWEESKDGLQVILLEK